jgi:hypothetical protein
MADLCIQVNNQYSYVEAQCKGFPGKGEPDFSVAVTDEEIAAEQAGGSFSAGYCESICVYRKICEILPSYNIFLMHSAVIEVGGWAYAFTAKSGVGKSTHLGLWLKNIEGARVLNGDKPLYRIEKDGKITVFGTPWNGKENWGVNASATLRAVCFIERGIENRIRKAPEHEVIARLMHQLYLRGSRESVDRQLMLMNELVKAVPYYILSCNISDEAALLSYETMSRGAN